MRNKDFNYKQNNYRKTDKIVDRKTLLYIIIFVLMILLLIFVIKHNRRYIVSANYGRIVDGFKTEALIIRDEKVVRAPVSGRIEVKQKEGRRLGYGEAVVTIKNSSSGITLYNHQPGIVSYAVDELENVLKPDSIGELKSDRIDNYRRDYRQLVSGEHVSTGEAVFRIINNYEMYLALKTEVEEAERYRNNELVFIRPPDPDGELIAAYIVNKNINGDGAVMVVKLNRFLEKWTNIRRVKVEFIKNIHRGIIIPRSAIFSQPEGDGVLIYKAGGDYSFKQVTVIDGTGDKVVVSGLEIGDNVIYNPAAYNYGQGGGK